MKYGHQVMSSNQNIIAGVTFNELSTFSLWLF